MPGRGRVEISEGLMQCHGREGDMVAVGGGRQDRSRDPTLASDRSYQDKEHRVCPQGLGK